MSVLLYVHQLFSPFPLPSTKVAHSLLILLPIPIVLLLYSPLTSRPSQIAGLKKPRPLLLFAYLTTYTLQT